MALVAKNPLADAGDIRDPDSIPGSGRSSDEGKGNPLQYSCLANTMDRAAWQATVHGVTKSWIRLKQLSTHVRNIHLVLSTGPNFQLIKLLEFPKCERQRCLCYVNEVTFRSTRLEALCVCVSHSVVSDSLQPHGL